MPNFIEIGGGSRKFSKKLVDLTRNDPTVARGRSVTWPHVPPVQVQFSSVYIICITELSGIDNIGLGIELELPSSELELNCLKDFVPDSELNGNCYYRNWN